MKLTFYGAAREVTGSNFLLEFSGNKILIDCGMFQGSEFNDARNHDAFAYNPSEIQAVILTHAHLDHCGRIPRLVREGFNGAIHGTFGTIKLAELIWKDAVNIMNYEYKKYGSPIVYGETDVEKAVKLCVGHAYDEWFEAGSAFKDGSAFRTGIAMVRLREAGHIFGSSFAEIEVLDKKLVFSGDLGNRDVPILKDTADLENADALVIESTYGNRVHENSKERFEMLEKIVIAAAERGGVLMIPAFSIERTQELLYVLNELIEKKGSIPKMPIFLDSPLSIDAMKVYKEHPEYFDKEALALKKSGDDFFKFPGLTITRSQDESKKINEMKGQFIVIAGSGMMDGGRILHHALRFLPDPKSTLLITGFCARGTRGRAIIEGAKSVNIFGQMVPVNCKVESIKALSAHGDSQKLIEWAKGAGVNLKYLFTVHGEEDAMAKMCGAASEVFKNAVCVAPRFGESFEI